MRVRRQLMAGVAICQWQSRHALAALRLAVVLLCLSSALCQHSYHAAGHGLGGQQLADGEAAPPEEPGSLYAAFPPVGKVGGDGMAWLAVQSCPAFSADRW